MVLCRERSGVFLCLRMLFGHVWRVGDGFGNKKWCEPSAWERQEAMR